MFKIEGGIPFPDDTLPTHVVWPFKDMSVGDSVFVHSEKATAAASSAINFGKKKCRRFATRRWVQDGVPGVRVWRVS